MKTSLLLAISLLVFSSHASTNLETCDIGMSCEKASNGDIILRETSIILDESLELCQVTTIANFGPNENHCLEILNKQNQ